MSTLINSIFTTICQTDTLKNAWERVSENKGCRGSDGVTINRFEYRCEANLQSLQNDLKQQTYHPYPLLRFAVEKKNSNIFRYLSVPCVRDRIAQASAYLTTREIFEKEFETISHAYRPNKSVQTAIKDIKYWRDLGFRYAVDADIDAYFDNVPHNQLIKKLYKLIPEKKVMDLFIKWIKADVYDGEKIWTLEKGIPQGSVVSPILANLYLDELDEILISFDRKLVRYADDFLILSKTEKEAVENVELTDMLLEDLQLDLNPVKTKIVSFDEGFKFLGAIFLFDDVYLPQPQKRNRVHAVKLPPPLTLKKYLELKNKQEL